jgi:hypothetical protein
VRMPPELWLSAAVRLEAAAAFAIADPFERFSAVNAPHARRARERPLLCTLPSADGGGGGGAVAVLDLHYQSVKTAASILDARLAEALRGHAEVWLVTGTGHHTDRHSHQKHVSGGVLHAAVGDYLSERGYRHHLGKDQGGQGGAFLVVPRA